MAPASGERWMNDGYRLDAIEQDLIVFFYKLVLGNRYRSRLLADLKEVPERGPFLAKLVSDRHTEVLSAALDELEAG
jgi:hypothetical protein